MNDNFLQINTDRSFLLPQTALSPWLLHVLSPFLLFDQHIKSVTCLCFCHLRSKSVVSQAELLLHAFVSSHLDYSLFSKSSVDCLNLVQNAVARLLTRSSMSTHMMAILNSLQWLPVKFRIHLKTLFIVYNTLHSQASEYIADLLHHYILSRTFRSGSACCPGVQLKSKGNRAFKVVAPTLWNSLPTSFSAVSTEALEKQLKTSLQIGF